MGFEIIPADFAPCQHEGREDQQRKVQIAQDGVAGGDQGHNAQPGGKGTEQQHHGHERCVLQRGGFILLSVELGIAGDGAVAEAYDRAEHGKKHGDHINDFDAAQAQRAEHPIKGQGVGGGVHHVMTRNGGGGDEEQRQNHQHGRVAANADDGGQPGRLPVRQLLTYGGDVADHVCLEGGIDDAAPDGAGEAGLNARD